MARRDQCLTTIFQFKLFNRNVGCNGIIGMTWHEGFHYYLLRSHQQKHSFWLIKATFSLSMRMPPTESVHNIHFIYIEWVWRHGKCQQPRAWIRDYKLFSFVWRWFGLYNDNRIASSPAIQLPVRAFEFVCPWGSYDDGHSVWIDDEAGRII